MLYVHSRHCTINSGFIPKISIKGKKYSVYCVYSALKLHLLCFNVVLYDSISVKQSLNYI
jgi:hypothetical protein